MPTDTDTVRAPEDIDAFLAAQDRKDQLRFVICGSVDDGKSTLLGRLLYDSKTVFEDQVSAARSESRTYGTQGDAVDLALLVDGLQAEREQGITIDVAYRYFESDRRRFIAIDTPGHEQYTRNMATGASNADIALVLVDARKGDLVRFTGIDSPYEPPLAPALRIDTTALTVDHAADEVIRLLEGNHPGTDG